MALDWTRVDNALERASVVVGERPGRNTVFPGAVLVVGMQGDVVYQRAVGSLGNLAQNAPVTLETVFDVASLTKPIVTTTLVMEQVERAALDLDRRVSVALQTFGTGGREAITFRQLLTHTSGLPATLPLWKVVEEAHRTERLGLMATKAAKELVYQQLFHTPLIAPPGTRTVYSDLGFILLGAALEVLNGGNSLDRLASNSIFQPLGLKNSGFIDLSRLRRRGLEPVKEMIAPTLQCDWRSKLLWGEVHDDNAWAMGGIAGHAGLFSTAADVHLFAAEMIRCYRGYGRLFTQETVRRFWEACSPVAGSSWALGWDHPSKQGSSAGELISRKAVGHLGYTGCSLWIDPEAELDIVLLSNRINSDDRNQTIKSFRPLIHDLVLETIGVRSQGPSR